MHKKLSAVYCIGSCLLLTFCASNAILAQTEVKLMCYNLLNFPEGSIPNRQDTLKKLITYVQPDLLFIQELKSEQGLSAIVEESFADLESEYAAAPYVSQQSNPSTGNPLQQALVYNTSLFTLAQSGVVLTPYRDFNRFKLLYNDPELPSGADSTFLYVFVTHLKSSQGSDNEAIRLQMAQAWRDYVNDSVPTDAQIIVTGDFNVYSSLEPAYEELLGEDQEIVMRDPLDAPGVWHDSGYPYKEILTQSSRENAIFSDGAGGGVDDRFDFILMSDNMISGSGGFHFAADSYRALGNNGSCYNQSITDCDQDNEVPLDILRAMYYMSDHLPVIAQLTLNPLLSMNRIKHHPLEIYPNPAQSNISIVSPFNSEVEINFLDISGRLVKQTVIFHGVNLLSIEDLKSGYYFIQADPIFQFTPILVE